MRLLLILMLCGCGYISDAQNTVFDQTKASAVLKHLLMVVVLSCL